MEADMINDISQLPFFDMKNCYDLFKKLEYDYSTLSRENMNCYYLMNFLATSNHLKDWVKNDKQISEQIKSDLLKYFDLGRNKEFDVIKSLCNRSKHFEKSDYDYEKMKIEGFSFANLDFGDVNFGGDEYFVQMDQEKINIFDICEKNFMDWQAFFKKHEQELFALGYVRTI